MNITYQQREEIFAKEALSLEDFEILFGISKSAASEKMSQIKRKIGDRLGIKGKLHIQDYLDYFNIPNTERYSRSKNQK